MAGGLALTTSACDKGNGDLLWHADAALVEGRDGLAYANPPGGSPTAYDPRTGVVRWTAPAAHASVPVAHGDAVHLSAPDAALP
ncbi:hypothetical protein ACFY7H_13785 [Streptomyces sp. NPDC012794]|uniref:hypothetical protein n=1 Tax=Streptomyces sp. NPDC012794 TaxID=3364850 RepID=UPI0036C1245C